MVGSFDCLVIFHSKTYDTVCLSYSPVERNAGSFLFGGMLRNTAAVSFHFQIVAWAWISVTAESVYKKAVAGWHREVSV